MNAGNDHDADRLPALSACVDEINTAITAAVAKFQDQTGHRVQFHLLMVADDYFEHLASIHDFNMIADAFVEITQRWVEEGRVTLIEDIDDPLFTATFDPEKVRPS